jgi:hypothetical protein
MAAKRRDGKGRSVARAGAAGKWLLCDWIGDRLIGLLKPFADQRWDEAQAPQQRCRSAGQSNRGAPARYGAADQPRGLIGADTRDLGTLQTRREPRREGTRRGDRHSDPCGRSSRRSTRPYRNSSSL